MTISLDSHPAFPLNLLVLRGTRMARLVVNPGSPAAWEITLKPGDNFIGRGFSNDFKLTDPSVSGSHCQITVSDGAIVIKDLGSTNGTYVNRAPVHEAVLQTGQSVHLGGVEMVFYADAPASVTTTQTAPPAVRMVGAPVRATAAPIAPPPPPSAPVPARTSRLSVPVALPLPPPPLAVPPAASSAPAAPPPVAAPALAVAPPPGGKCKHHPKTLGRFFCNQCQVYYCELCITTRNVLGVSHKFCRQCGSEVVPVQVQAFRRPSEKGFFSRLPGAFIYPLRGSGLLMLIGGTIVMSALKFFIGSGGIRYALTHPRWTLIGPLLFYGYLFTYLQSIIHATAAEDRELPPIPGMSNFLEDIILPAFRLLGLSLFCFGPAIGLGFFVVTTQETSLAWTIIAAFVFGLCYFPMAFLAVAILDTFVAANPLQVIPSILKAPLEYLVTLILLAGVWGVSTLGDLVIPMLFPRGLLTHSMAKLVGYLATEAVWALVGLYLLVLATHILGLLYVSKKTKLGWLQH